MAQAVAAYALVAAAAGWVAWSMLVPRKVKMRLKGKRTLPR